MRNDAYSRELAGPATAALAIRTSARSPAEVTRAVAPSVSHS